jgi:hypothetical protein
MSTPSDWLPKLLQKIGVEKIHARLSGGGDSGGITDLMIEGKVVPELEKFLQAIENALEAKVTHSAQEPYYGQEEFTKKDLLESYKYQLILEGMSIPGTNISVYNALSSYIEEDAFCYVDYANNEGGYCNIDYAIKEDEFETAFLDYGYYEDEDDEDYDDFEEAEDDDIAP